MGGSQSATRSANFQNENEASPEVDPDDVPESHHISISNKMVERLVEDATLAGGAASTPSAVSMPYASVTDQKEKVLMEKLKRLDDVHSERTGLTIEEVKAMAKRVEMRSHNYLTPEPVCADTAQRVVDCYASRARPQDCAKCWEPINEYNKCVREAALHRVRARNAVDALHAATRTRHVARAREHLQRNDIAKPVPS